MNGYNTIYTWGDKNESSEIFSIDDENDESDNKSLLDSRERKKQWNSILSKRKNLAEQIFGKKVL